LTISEEGCACMRRSESKSAHVILCDLPYRHFGACVCTPVDQKKRRAQRRPSTQSPKKRAGVRTPASASSIPIGSDAFTSRAAGRSG
jgi:hypothetical protein